jgi:hypothetical protein
MNKYVLPLVCAAAAVALRTSSASITAPPSVDHATHYVGYFQQDADSDVQTESDSAGNYDVFYDRLAPEGRWFQQDDYGYVWQPNVAVSTTNWRPYSDGHWVWTDRGWFWDSNEDFGWATYHYGRWILVDGVGWVWVPGQHWAPAWVSWRHTDDDDYVGWAPLPPESTFNVSVGVHPWCDSYYDIGPAAYAFIQIGNFSRQSYREYCLPPQQSLVIVNRTTNITNITYDNNVINNYGPQYQRVSQLVQQRGGQQVPNYRINYAAQTQANAAFKTSAQGNQLNVVAPPQRLKPVATLKPQVAKELGKAQVDRGWRNVPQTQAQQLREQYTQQTPVPKTLPAKPVLPVKPQFQTVIKGEQHPPNEPGKGQQPAGGQLKPFVEKPENKATGEQKKLETEKAKTVQPENVKPGEPPKKPAVVTEEKKAGTEAIATKKPKVNEVKKGEGEHAKKEPSGPPQAKTGHQIEQHQSHTQPHVAEAHVSQPHVSQPHVSQPHVSQPHVSQASHPKSNPPPQPHRSTSNNNQKKKDEHKE